MNTSSVILAFVHLPKTDTITQIKPPYYSLQHQANQTSSMVDGTNGMCERYM